MTSSGNHMSTEESTQVIPSQNVKELQAKIDKLRDIILDFLKTEKQTYRGVKQLFSEIIQDAEKLKVNKNELRRMLHEAFHARGPQASKISESYLRRLLPPQYKYSMKARLDYKERHEKEEQEWKESTQALREAPTAAVQIQRGDEPEEMHRLKRGSLSEYDKPKVNEQGDEVWTDSGTVQFGGIKLLLIITVNSTQKKIVNIELDLNKYFINNEDMKNSEV